MACRDEWSRAYHCGLGRVGDKVRLLGGVSFGSEPYLVFLGSNVTVSDRVRFITHDGGVGMFCDEHPGVNVFAPITVGDRVFIGSQATLLPGVTIGSDVVIGAAASLRGTYRPA